MNETCETCKFFALEAGAEGGECRRHPPKLIPLTIDGELVDIATRWPFVDLDEWCGEHEKAQVAGSPRTEQCPKCLWPRMVGKPCGGCQLKQATEESLKPPLDDRLDTYAPNES